MRHRIFAALAAVLAAGACAPAPSGPSEHAGSGKPPLAARGNALPPQVVQALADIDEADLVSLEPLADPKAQGRRLQGYLVLGSTRLSRPQARAAAAGITSAVAAFDGMIAACFDPRHALRFQSAGRTYLMLVCFECRSLQVFEGGRLIGGAALTGSPADLNAMLSSAKVPISHSAEQSDEDARAEQVIEQRWRAAMPTSVRPVWSDQFMGMGDDLRPIRTALAKEFPDPQDRIRALLGWFGSGAGPWSGYPSYEGVVEELLLDYPTDEIVHAVVAGDRSEVQMEGAARLFAGWEFNRRRPEGRAQIPEDLRKVLLAHSLKTNNSDKAKRAKRAFAEDLME